MSLADVVNSLSGTDEEVLAAVKARTIAVRGAVSGSALQNSLIKHKLLPFIYDTARNQSETDEILRGICIGLITRIDPQGSIGLITRIDPQGSIDLSDTESSDLLIAFLARQAVIDKLTAGAGVAAFRNEVLAKADSIEPEFPSVKMIDIVAIRRPTDVVDTETNAVEITPQTGAQFKFFLSLMTALPGAVNPIILVRHNDGTNWSEWRAFRVSSLSNVQAAGVYQFGLSASDMSSHCQVKVRIPYSASVSLG